MQLTILGQARGELIEDGSQSLASGLPILLSEFADKIFVAVDDSLAFEVAREYHIIGKGEVVGVYTSDQDLTAEQEQSLDLRMEADTFYDLRGSLASKSGPVIVLGLSPEVLATISFLAARPKAKQSRLIVFKPAIDQGLPEVLLRKLRQVTYVQSLSDVESILEEIQ